MLVASLAKFSIDSSFVQPGDWVGLGEEAVID